MYCGHCGASVPEDSALCPECGAPIEGTARELEPAEGEMYPVLAAANLARLRGDFEEATGRCIEVLRRYPNNATAHSLIGDIYADQGLLRDAAQWYKLALELDPSSQADRRKLETLTKRLSAPARGEGAAPAPASSARARRTLPGTGLSKALGLGMGAVVVVLLAVLVGAAVYRRTTAAQLANTQKQASRPIPAAFPVKNPPSAPPTPLAPSASESASREERLLASLRQAALSSESTDSVEYVALDPRDETGETALIVFRVKQAQTLEDTKRRVLQSVLEIGRAAVERDSSLDILTLRGKAVIGESRQSQPELVLVAEMAKSRLAALTVPAASPVEIAGLLRDTWWHPALRHIGF